MATAWSFGIIGKASARRFHRWAGYAFSLTGDAADAEDLVQDAITRTLQANPCLKNEWNAHQYILTALHSAVLQLLEQRRELAMLGAPPWQRRAAENADPLAEMLAVEAEKRARELQHRALARLAELPEPQRQAIELLVMREPPMKLREVSEIQDAAISTVYSRLCAGLSALGRGMLDNGGGRKTR